MLAGFFRRCPFRRFAPVPMALALVMALPCPLGFATGADDIARLIEKLGHPSYASRERAKSDLRKLGLEALDQLQQARYHPDNEIAMSARRLIASRLIDWSEPTDAEEVRQTLAGYGSLSGTARQGRIDRLAELPPAAATPPLARLARFETDAKLGLSAALALMEQPLAEDSRERTLQATQILETVGRADRISCQWLRRHAEDLREGGFQLSAWSEMLRRQRQSLDRNTNPAIDADLLWRFVNVLAVRASRQGYSSQALELVRENLDLVSPTPNDLTNAATWALQHEFYPLIFDLKDRHGRLFDKEPLLLYSAAQAAVETDQAAAAEDFAEAALQTNPIPESAEQQQAMNQQELRQRAHRHNDVAEELRERGFFRWAEREYDYVISRSEIESLEAGAARQGLASMHSDLFEHEKVIAVLNPLIERLKIDEELQRKFDSRRLDLDGMVALEAYHRGLLRAEQNDSEAAKSAFEIAKNHHLQRIDTLIAMYRLDGGEDYRRYVNQLLAIEIRQLEQGINDATRKFRQLGSNNVYVSELVTSLNLYAWLVSNTTGDYEKALISSEQSVKLRPNDAGLIDTLARCHFALGDIDEAIRWQTKAVRLDPHLPPLQRQWDEFKAAKSVE